MITSFSGKDRWLSNFWVCEVKYESVLYPSSEHAYVAAKTLNLVDRIMISRIPSAAEVKKYGRNITLRPNWDEIKVEEMYIILLDKFIRNLDLRQKLLDTGDQMLIEGNWWGDTFWGECPLGIGQNNLGKLLMKIRNEI